MATKKFTKRWHSFKDLTGQKFGKLTAVSALTELNADRRKQWVCVCDCGNTKTAPGRYLQGGQIISCGCAKRVRFRAMVTKHGHAGTTEYHSWQSAKGRCFNPDDKKFVDYGGRGITMCDRWKNSFQAFFDDMGPRPKGTSIDRIDNNGNYEPGNCRWATRTTQVRNRRVTIFITHDGVTRSLPEWAEVLGMKYDAAKSRYRNGSLFS